MAKRVNALSQIDIFFKRCLYWMKQLFISTTNSLKNGRYPSKDQFPFVSGIKLVIWTKYSSEKPISRCICLLGLQIFCTWDESKNQIWWNFWFWWLGHRNLIKSIQSIQTASETTWCCLSAQWKWPGGYGYIARARWSNSSLLGHLTELRFFREVKLFLRSIFNLIDFWSSISCFVLNIELAEKKRL